MKRIAWLLIPAMAMALAVPAPAAAFTSVPNTPPKPYVLATQTQRSLAQGLTLTSFERLYPSGWVNGWLLEADLAHPAIRTDLITAPGVTKGEALSSMAGRAGAVAAVNGDFFDIGQTGIALGTVVKNGEFLQSRIPEWPHAASVGKDRIGRLMEIALTGTVTLPGGAHPLGAINLPTVPSHSIGLFTPLWTISREKAMVGAYQATEVVVRQGKVVSVSPVVTAGPVPTDGYVLVGREEYAAPMAALKVGDPVALSYRPQPDIEWAVGGMRYLVGHGKVVEGLDDSQYKPRTALGFSEDGQRLFLLAVDGRSARSGGLTLRQLAEMMHGFGAVEVLELDGGGSTTMVARMPGAQGLSLINQPSDGRERSIPNGVGIFAAPGSGVAKYLELKGESRLFPGLARRFEAAAYDEQFGAAKVGGIHWWVEGGGKISPQGLFRAEGTEPASITAMAILLGQEPVTLVPMSDRLDLRILGPLTRIEVEGEGLRLQPGASATFRVRGYDHDGFTATIDPSDLTLTYDPELVQVEAAGESLRVTPLQGGMGLIGISVQGHEIVVPFASALTSGTMEAFDKLERWSFQRYPDSVQGGLSAAQGRSSDGLKLTYAFGAGGSRAAYAQADPGIELPGQPESFGLWVKGDGKGAWLRAVLIDGKNGSHTVDLARHVDWTDLRYVEAQLPTGLTYPVRLHRVYPVEVDQTKQYTGELIFADLTVRMPVELPPAPPAPPLKPDLILQPTAPAGEQSWRFALVGGLGLEAGGEPAVALAAQQRAEEKIRQALAQNPAFILLDGAGATPAGDALVRTEAGAIPVHPIAPPARHLDRDGVRFLVLGTEKGSLWATQFDQLATLQAQLAAAEADPQVQKLVVVGGSSLLQLPDQREAELVRRWLTEFEERSGKSAVYLGGGGSAPSVTRVEGIPIIEAGSQEGPVVITIDPTPGAVWIRMGPGPSQQ